MSTENSSRFTGQQCAAIQAKGNVLLSAGAGTGKTATLVERCIQLVLGGASLERILMVTFTNAAAAEMKQRIREALQKKQLADPANDRIARQVALLDCASISTIHSFCLQLVRAHFEELGLDPQVCVLEEAQTRPLARETADKVIADAIVDTSDFGRGTRQFLANYCANRAERLRDWILQLHRFFTAMPDAESRLEQEMNAWKAPNPQGWAELLENTLCEWVQEEKERVIRIIPQVCAKIQSVKIGKGNADKAAGIASLILKLSALGNCLCQVDSTLDPKKAGEIFDSIGGLLPEELWIRGTVGHRKPLDGFFEEARELALWLPGPGKNPLQQDWELVRQPMAALCELVQRFSRDFSRAKRMLGGVDFADLEQLVLKLLGLPASPTQTALRWREQLDYIFVDECQDINAAQDAIVRTLSREGGRENLFMVGDVKQSIYRFRLAAPELFRGYSNTWQGRENHTVLQLTDNFRSREGVVHFVNELFAHLMGRGLGGIKYDEANRLQFGDPVGRKSLSISTEAGTPKLEGEWLENSCRVELHLVSESGDESDDSANEWDDCLNIERESIVLANRLQELEARGHQVWDKEAKSFRKMEWRDVGILMRSLSGRAGYFAAALRERNIPVAVERGSFLDALEALDLVSILQLIDNPRQDIPLFSVLRSPLVGLTLDELALFGTPSHQKSVIGSGWDRLNQWPAGVNEPTSAKVRTFLAQFSVWRDLSRQTSLSCVLEQILNDTGYEAFLLTRPDGEARVANVRRMLELARRYDPLQRQGLFRFLQFIKSHDESGLDIEPTPPKQSNAVRILSIHKSKGLEFPVVALAVLGSKFNTTDLNRPILITASHGIAPVVVDGAQGLRYESLPYWAAKRQELMEIRAEELRLFYVAITRARDTLLLCGSIPAKLLESREEDEHSAPPAPQIDRANSHMDWLKSWMADTDWSLREGEKAFAQSRGFLRWRVHEQLPASVQQSSLEAAPAPLALPENWPSLVAWEYPHLPATLDGAKTSVTALKKRAAKADEEATVRWQAKMEFSRNTPAKDKLSASEKGLAHHAFLQYVALNRTGDRASLQAEAQRMVQEGHLTSDEMAALNLESLLEFWKGEVGGAIASCQKHAHREMPFTASFKPSELRQLIGPDACLSSDEEFIVIQGVVDLAVLREEEIWILDFKTDRFDPSELGAKIAEYSPQLLLYARALERIHRRPVTQCWLHFLHTNQTPKVSMS